MFLHEKKNTTNSVIERSICPVWLTVYVEFCFVVHSPKNTDVNGKPWIVKL